MLKNTKSILSASLNNLFAPESWNKKRSAEELRSFVNSRLENCLEDSDFGVEV